MRATTAVLVISVLALVGVSTSRAQSLADQARDLALHSQQNPAARNAPRTVPDWAPPGTELPGQNGVTRPKIVHEVKPYYSAEAMHAKIQGTVVLQCIVDKEGRVGEVRVIDSLDKVHGLDDEAVKAAKKWRFSPATKAGVAVPVVVSIDMTFTLR